MLSPVMEAPIGAPSSSQRRAAQRQLPLERGLGIDIGLLPVDAPVAQLRKRDAPFSDRAGDVGAGNHDLIIAVEVPQPRLAVAAAEFVSVHPGLLAKLYERAKVEAHHSAAGRCSLRLVGTVSGSGCIGLSIVSPISCSASLSLSRRRTSATTSATSSAAMPSARSVSPPRTIAD